MSTVMRKGRRVKVLSFGEKDKPAPASAVLTRALREAASETTANTRVAAAPIGSKIEPGPLHTIAIRTDPITGLGTVYMRTLDGAEFEHGVSSGLAVRLASDLLKVAFRNRAEPQILLAINAIRPFAV